LPVLQPESPAEPGFVDAFRALAPDLGVVVAYGHLLKTALLAIPPRGMINVHASLLPLLRGAAPIEHAILQNLSETGVSIMQLEAGMDAGPVYHRVPTPIAPDETGGELTTRLAELGALALIEALAAISTGTAAAEPQDHTRATLAPKLTRATAHITWSAPAETIGRQVRALDPRPGAWTTLGGREAKLFGPAMVAADAAAPGTVLAVEPRLRVATGSGALEFLEAQPAGGARMPSGAWARGRGPHAGQRFE
jgi:methionyl-tRNA formyltransferase